MGRRMGRRMGEWTPQRLTRWAGSVAPATGALIATVVREREHAPAGLPRRPRHPAPGQEPRRDPPRGRPPAGADPGHPSLPQRRVDPAPREAAPQRLHRGRRLPSAARAGQEPHRFAGLVPVGARAPRRAHHRPGARGRRIGARRRRSSSLERASGRAGRPTRIAPGGGARVFSTVRSRRAAAGTARGRPVASPAGCKLNDLRRNAHEHREAPSSGLPGRIWGGATAQCWRAASRALTQPSRRHAPAPPTESFPTSTRVVSRQVV